MTKHVKVVNQRSVEVIKFAMKYMGFSDQGMTKEDTDNLADVLIQAVHILRYSNELADKGHVDIDPYNTPMYETVVDVMDWSNCYEDDGEVTDLAGIAAATLYRHMENMSLRGKVTKAAENTIVKSLVCGAKMCQDLIDYPEQKIEPLASALEKMGRGTILGAEKVFGKMAEDMGGNVSAEALSSCVTKSAEAFAKEYKKKYMEMSANTL